jgi:hypothetical protein
MNSGRLRNGQSILLLLTAAMLLGAASDAQEAAKSTRELVDRAYLHIIRGNKADLETNSKAAIKYAERAAEVVAAAKKKPEFAKRAQQEVEIARLLKELADANANIAKGFDDMNFQLINKGMEAIPKLEEQLAPLIRKTIERDWMTFKEVEQMSAKGYRYKTRHPDIKPYSRANWQLTDDQKKAEAKEKMNRIRGKQQAKNKEDAK